MKTDERRLLKELVHYWDGVREQRWENGPVPERGDYVLERAVSEKLGDKTVAGLFFDAEFSAAVGSLSNRGLIRREKTDLLEFEADLE